MFNKETLQYAEALIRSTKLQFVCAVSFGIPLFFYYRELDLLSKITLLVFSLLPLSALFFSFGEFLKKLYEGHKKKKDKLKKWNDLSVDEREIISHFINKNNSIEYLPTLGDVSSWSDAVETLIKKKILYVPTSDLMITDHSTYPVKMTKEAFDFYNV